MTRMAEGPGCGRGGRGRARVEGPLLGGGEVREPKAKVFGRIVSVTEGTKAEGRTQHWTGRLTEEEGELAKEPGKFKEGQRGTRSLVCAGEGVMEPA